MRKTVDIPTSVYRRLKSQAARLGCTVEDLILRRIEGKLDPTPKRKGRRVKLPLVRSGRPATLFLDNAKIFEIIPFP